MTNLNIAKLYLAANPTKTATEIDAAITSGAADTAVKAMTTAQFLAAAYKALFNMDTVDPEGLAYWTKDIADNSRPLDDSLLAMLKAGAEAYVAPTAEKPLVINGVSFTTGYAGIEAAKTAVAAKVAAEAAANGTSYGDTAVALKTVVDTATANVAKELIDNAEYNAALTTYNTAVTAAATAKTAADAAALTVSTVALATAAKTAADSSKTAADAVVTAATALNAAALVTVSSADNVVAANAVTAAATAQATAATAVTTAATALTTAEAAAAAAAALGTTFTLTTGADVTMFGTTKSDTWNATQATYTADDIIVDSSTVDNDTLNVVATDDIGNKPTIIGVENVNFNLTGVTTTGVATDFNIDATNISSGKITAAVTNASSTVNAAVVTNVKTGVTVATNLATLDVTNVADDADITVNLTASTAQKLDALSSVAGSTGIDTVTVNASGNFQLTETDTDETLTINGQGSVTVDDWTPVTVAAANVLTVSAKGAITVSDLHTAGNVSLTTTTGDVTYAAASKAAGADKQNLSISTDAGDVTVTNAINMDGTVTITAKGDAGALGGATVKDGDVTVTAADHAETINITASGAANIVTADLAETVTISAGQDSSLDGLLAVETLNLTSSVSVDATTDKAVVFTLASTGANDNDELENINFNGTKSITLAIADLNDLVAAQEDASNGTTAAAVIATDNTGATTTIKLSGDLGNAKTLDLTKLAVDNIQIATVQTDADNTVDEIFKVASGAKIEIKANQSDASVADGSIGDAHLEFTAAAVAGNSMTLTINDDNTADDTTAYAVEDLKTTNITTVNYVLNDSEAAVAMNTINVGTAADIFVTGAGDLTVATSVVAKNFDASASTGDMSIQIVDNATIYKTGTGKDTFTFTAAVAAAAGDSYTIDGGAGADTIKVVDATSFVGSTISFTNVEKIELIDNEAADILTFDGTQMNGKSFIFVTNGGHADDKVVVADQSGIGSTINLSATTMVNGVLQLDGGAGGDILTGSATTATTINGLNGNDNITGGAGADIIAGGAGDDAITAGDGADIIAGGTGADTINLTETVSAIDTIKFDQGDGSAVGVAAGTFTGYDVITGFALSKDIIDTNDNIANNTNVVVAKNAAATDAKDLTDADFTNVDKIVAFMNDTTTVSALGATSIDTIAITFSNFTAIYVVDNDGTAAIVAGEVELLATVNGVLTATEIA